MGTRHWLAISCCARGRRRVRRTVRGSQRRERGPGRTSTTGTGNVWFIQFATTINPQTSTIVITDTGASSKTFAGAGAGAVTYNKLTIAGGGTGAVTINLNTLVPLTINTLTPGAGTPVKVTAGQTLIVQNLVATGSSGNVIAISSTTPGTQATLSKPNGTVSCDWLSLTDIAATGGASWFAGANSTLSNCTGWLPQAPPANSSRMLAMFR
jgi:hypothetical protein